MNAELLKCFLRFINISENKQLVIKLIDLLPIISTDEFIDICKSYEFINFNRTEIFATLISKIQIIKIDQLYDLIENYSINISNNILLVSVHKIHMDSFETIFEILTLENNATLNVHLGKKIINLTTEQFLKIMDITEPSSKIAIIQHLLKHVTDFTKQKIEHILNDEHISIKLKMELYSDFLLEKQHLTINEFLEIKDNIWTRQSFSYLIKKIDSITLDQVEQIISQHDIEYQKELLIDFAKKIIPDTFEKIYKILNRVKSIIVVDCMVKNMNLTSDQKTKLINIFDKPEDKSYIEQILKPSQPQIKGTVVFSDGENYKFIDIEKINQDYLFDDTEKPIIVIMKNENQIAFLFDEKIRYECELENAKTIEQVDSLTITLDTTKSKSN